MSRITPFLWYDDKAEEAVQFYASVFKDHKIGRTMRMEHAGIPGGKVLTIEFQLNGQDFVAMNGGPAFRFDEAVSFMVECRDQAEVDHYWSKLTADGGQESQCGWLKDKYGLSWQITPRLLLELVAGKDPVKAKKAFEAMLNMKKIDIQKIRDAAGV
jgi:predicted 3-demethylubiquinone-9 3-methyltransferase (glyoxalase superfamily)